VDNMEQNNVQIFDFPLPTMCCTQEKEGRNVKAFLSSGSSSGLLDDLLGLLQNLLGNLLDELALALVGGLVLGSGLFGADLGKTLLLALVAQLGGGAFAPCEPLVEKTTALLDNSAVGGVLAGNILLLELLAPFAEVLADSLLFLLGQETLGAWAPGELLELVDGVLAEELTAEIVQVVTVFHLLLLAFCLYVGRSTKLTRCFQTLALVATKRPEGSQSMSVTP